MMHKTYRSVLRDLLLTSFALMQFAENLRDHHSLGADHEYLERVTARAYEWWDAVEELLWQANQHSWEVPK